MSRSKHVHSLALVPLFALVARAAPAPAQSAVTPPSAIEQPAATWPVGAEQPHAIVVPVRVTVRADGTVGDVAVDGTLGTALDEAAVETARRWRFEPARQDGRAIEARIRIGVRFPPAAPAAPPPPPPAPLEVVVEGERPARSASGVTREREVLRAAPHRSADELLLVVPGVFITQHSGEGKAYQIFYRGFDAVHGQDLEVWAGGAPINDVSNVHGQGYADLHFLPVEIVRAVTATPGTYDPRQGDFAVAGSLRFDLGYDEPGVTAKAAAGSFGTRRAFLGWRPPSAPESTFAAVELYETDGFGPSRAAQRASAIGQLTHPLGAGTELRLLASAYAGHFASAGVVRLDDVELGRIGRFDTYDPTQGGASSRTQLVAEVSRREADATWALSSYLVLRTMRLRSNFTGYLIDPNGDSEQQLNDDVVAGATGSYRTRYRLLSDRDEIEAGFFARSDWIDQSQRRLALADDRVTANEVDARVRAMDVAGYLDLALRPWSRVTIRGGLRADGLAYQAQDLGGRAAGQARASQGTHVGKKATIDVRLAGALHGLISYGEGFRSPQARSLAEGETTPFTSVTSYEAGLRFATSRLSATAAAFRTALSDDLVFDQTTGRNERVPATRRTGAAVDVTLFPWRWLQGAASATYTSAVFTASDAQRRTGDLVPYAPQLVARADLAATGALGELRGRPLSARAGVGVSTLARRPLPYGQWGHDVFLADASAGIAAGRWSLACEVWNVFDASWFDGEFLYPSRWQPNAAASLVPQRHVTVGAPRTVLVTLALHL